MMKYRIEWINNKTMVTGHGEWTEDKDSLKACVEVQDRKYPEITHKIVSKAKNDMQKM